MAKRKSKKYSTPSGKVRLQIYNYSEPIFDENGLAVIDEKTGKQKQKRVYETIIADTMLEAQRLKAEFIEDRKNGQLPTDMSLRQAIEKYIKLSESALSPATISGYRKIQENAFQDIMDTKLSKLTSEMLRVSVSLEAKRKCNRKSGAISAKTLKNEYGLLVSVLNLYAPKLNTKMTLPQVVTRKNDISTPDVIFDIVKGTDIELPVLLAMWLSFTLSEIKGLYKSTALSPDGNYISIVKTSVYVNGREIEKDTTKQPKRRRTLRLPEYIKRLIDEVEGDRIVPMSAPRITDRWRKLVKKSGIPHMSFHDLRHVNASVMAMLGEDKVPSAYSQERGGWASDHVMKTAYTQIYDKKRKEVDDYIDDYFITALNLEETTVDEDELLTKLCQLDREKFKSVLHDALGPNYQHFINICKNYVN